jgi:hypothetical protein
MGCVRGGSGWGVGRMDYREWMVESLPGANRRVVVL